MASLVKDQINTSGELSSDAGSRRLSAARVRRVCRVFLSALAISILALSPLRVDISSQSADSVVSFSLDYSEAVAADRRGGRSGDRSGRGGGKGADRRGLDRNDSPGNGDAASSSGRSGSSSNSGNAASSSSNGSNSSPGADTASADAQGNNEAGADGGDAAEAEGGDRSPRSWFSIDASDMDTLNVGVIASRMGKAPSDPMPELCAALSCHDVR